MTLQESLHSAIDAPFADFDAQLEFVLDEEVDSAYDGSTPVSERLYQVTSADHADWTLRKIEQANEAIREINKLAEIEIDRVRAWQGAESKRHLQTIAFMEQLATTFHRKVIAENPDRKTIKLPHGTLTARAGQPGWSFMPEFIEWAKEQGLIDDLLRVKYEVDANKAKETLITVENLDGEIGATFDGEVVPGVEVTPAVTKFSVKTGDKS